MSLHILYRAEFVKAYSRLSTHLQHEVKEKIELFKDIKNHDQLKVHKLHGRLKGRMSFSVNYRYRIIFEYVETDTVVLKTVGDHEIYD